MGTPRRARAFTLIELLVVVAVIALLMALVGPSMRDLLSTQRVQGVNAELVTDLQFARSEAVRRSRPIGVRFGSNGSMTCYVIYEPGNVGNCRDCTLTPGSVCSGTWSEVRTVQLLRNTGVQLGVPAGQDAIVNFESTAGQNITAGEFVAEVIGTRRGQLRTTIGLSGRPTVCSQDGSIKQMPTCPASP